jgi:hypothetical protein
MVVVVVLFGRVKMFLPPICKVFNVMCFGRHGTKGRGTKKKEESGSGSREWEWEWEWSAQAQGVL